MNDFCFTFWTPGHASADDSRTFGCAAHGYANDGVWREPGAFGSGIWRQALPGESLAGTYDEVWSQLDRVAWRPAAALILFSHARGIEAFLEKWNVRFAGMPAAGGGAALGAGQTAGDLLPAAADVAVLLIRGGRWRVETLNVHDRTGQAFEFRASGLRTITQLRDGGDWQPAASALRALQAAHGRTETDCESLTFSDAGGRNIHCRFDGEELHTGADLPAEGRLECRLVSRADVAKRLAEFCAVSDALVFGCAGLRSLLDAPLLVAAGNLVGFMFGELVTIGGRPQFGNLMASRLALLAETDKPTTRGSGRKQISNWGIG
ncbi:MAG: hypothetical protein WCL16_10120 [bacterium]